MKDDMLSFIELFCDDCELKSHCNERAIQICMSLKEAENKKINTPDPAQAQMLMPD